MTAREIEDEESVSGYVKRVGMEFSSTNHMVHPLIKNGIIFVGYNAKTKKPNDKGELLTGLISDGILGENIKSILFIDDRKDNLEDVKKKLHSDIKFTGYHYTEGTNKYSNFLPETLDMLEECQYDSFVKNDLLPPSDKDCMEQFFSE